MNDDDLVIEDDEDNDMDGSHSQGNDHTNMPTADEGANDGHDDDDEEEDNGIDYDAPRGPSTIDWNFQYR
ncbi:hypothetical protein ZWY2020_030858 [Hordeum vulgare]|nr:hypothetical protein ZWY2020_030858 [Hordeum vulgare]